MKYVDRLLKVAKKIKLPQKKVPIPNDLYEKWTNKISFKKDLRSEPERPEPEKIDLQKLWEEYINDRTKRNN